MGRLEAWTLDTSNREAPLSAHFKVKEFQCHHCNKLMLNPLLIESLEQLRDAVCARRSTPLPIIVTSGYRCEAHNAEVGVKNSQHRLGNAADILVPGLPLQELFDAAKLVPAFKGIGVYPAEHFLHVDVRIGTRVFWGQLDGVYVPISDLVNKGVLKHELV